ncbi:MAG: M20/M25/M40 family metallo-hydrolase [Planctomycetes bacterium]|nr:M20/M25/M40 family metallo-hydrolase [Planctomycetota bacterium]
MHSSLALALALLAALAADERATTPAVTAADLEAHVRFLASDELRGRATGTPENVRAARYLAGELERFGWAPAGDEGGYLQRLDFQREHFTALPELRLGERAATYGADFRVIQGAPAGELRLRFVRSAEELPGEADPGLALVFVDVRRNRARAWLEEAGFPLGAGFGAVLTPSSRLRDAETVPPPPGRLHLASAMGAAPVAWFEYGEALGAALLAAPDAVLHHDAHYELEALPSYNVVARLAGAGTPERPELAREAVVLSAHFDHLGERAPREGDGAEADLVYNGADDDASGVATVLEVAEALAAGPRPAREVIVLLATAEEIGVVGSEAYLDHPATPLDRTVCNLNFEMVGRPDANAGGPGKLWLTGGERTNLLAAFQAAGLDVVQDPYPEQNYFFRSDNIVFVNRGIVGQTLSTYDGHEDYHHVSDEADTLDYAHLEGAARAGLAATRLLVDGALDPAWLEGMRPPERRRGR